MYQGEKFDCGSKEGFVHATIALALRDKTISKDIKQIIREIIWIFFLKFLNYYHLR